MAKGVGEGITQSVKLSDAYKTVETSEKFK